ncbi:MAG TPA: 50S ribosomal protein L28, partial [bacterium]|nr:50S ribosomal protein L28 [bacterium]
RACEVCNRSNQFGHKVSHAHNVTNRRWLANIRKMKVRLLGRVRRIYVCTRCLRDGKVQKVA